MPLRVGIDTVEVAAVEAAIAAHGDRYLERVYTPREVADCNGDAERLAARFAAKEATFKALRAGSWSRGRRSRCAATPPGTPTWPLRPGCGPRTRRGHRGHRRFPHPRGRV